MDTEPVYRLVRDEHNPLTINAVAGVTAPPAPVIEGDQLSENWEAARRAALILLHAQQDARDDGEMIQDLVSDLFHLCDLLGVDMDHLVNQAQRNYEAETWGTL